MDERGRKRCIIDTKRPWGVSTKNGETQFEVFLEAITTGGVAERNKDKQKAKTPPASKQPPSKAKQPPLPK